VANLDRYPTWILLLAAVASAVAFVLRYKALDRRPNLLRPSLMLLAGLLAVIGLARAGIFVTRGGERITPNEGLLILADLMAGMLVLSIPAGRATRRLTDGELRQLRSGNALQAIFGRKALFIVVTVVFGTMAALITAEAAAAAELPPPPAIAACRDYTTWLLAPANKGTMPPKADQGILAQAARVAPPGRLRQDLRDLSATITAAIPSTGWSQAGLDGLIVSGLDAVSNDCRSVPLDG
jgi:hypothetical protein